MLPPIPWSEISGPLAAAEDALARLDERLRSSPIADGWRARSHFAYAAASQLVDGELVSLEDLVLHDARMDVRAPTPALVRAHAVLRARRLIAAAEAAWPFSASGLATLRGERDGAAHDEATTPDQSSSDAAANADSRTLDEAWAEHLAAIDRVVRHSEHLLSGALAPQERGPDRSGLVYDPAWDETARLARWQADLRESEGLPPVLAAALAASAWSDIAPLQRAPWLGRLLVPALLRVRGKAHAHLPALNIGLRTVPPEHRTRRRTAARLLVWIHAVQAGAAIGLADHDRWLMARRQIDQRLAGRRSTSRLGEAAALALSRPIITPALLAQDLNITSRGALALIGDLGLREVTGRGRYRAWAIL